jgi:ribosomal-protein-alanine N-acetyltransferase
MAEEWVLRSGRESDLGAMFALDLVCFDETFQFDLRSMRRFALRRGAVVVVAEAGGDLVGFVIVHMERGRQGYVVTLDVAPDCRRKGLARALMVEAETRVAAAGAKAMGLHVYVGNSAAVGFYEGLGYGRVEAYEGFYGEGLDGWVYGKRL